MTNQISIQVTVGGLDTASLAKLASFLQGLQVSSVSIVHPEPDEPKVSTFSPEHGKPNRKVITKALAPAEPKAPRVRSAKQLAHDAELKQRAADRKAAGLNPVTGQPVDGSKEAAPKAAKKTGGSLKQGTPEYDAALKNHQAKVEGKPVVEEVTGMKVKKSDTGDGPDSLKKLLVIEPKAKKSTKK